MNYYLQAAKLILGLLFLTTLLRLLGKQNMSQLTPYDVVYLIVFGGVLDSTFYDDDIGLLPFIFSIVVWSISIYIIETLVSRYELLRFFFRGKPEHIVVDGKINVKLLEKNNIEMEQVRMLLRKSGIFSLEEVKDIYLEVDGSFSIIQYKDYQPITKKDLKIKEDEQSPNILLIDDGEIEYEALKYIRKTESWLKKELQKLGVFNLSDIFYCHWSKENGFYYKTHSDLIVVRKKGHLN